MLVTIEGIDGSGKSTLTTKFKEAYDKNNKAVFTSEPYSETKTHDIIRDLLGQTDIDPTRLLYLYMSNHISHVESFIRPQLNQGKTIFCDRYYDSMLVYQSTELESFLDTSEEPLLDDSKDLVYLFDELQNIGDFQLKPDVTLYIDISSEVAINRIKENREDIDRFETKKQLDELSKRYDLLCQQKDRIVRIDGEQNIEEVYSDCISVLENRDVLPL